MSHKRTRITIIKMSAPTVITELIHGRLPRENADDFLLNPSSSEESLWLKPSVPQHEPSVKVTLTFFLLPSSVTILINLSPDGLTGALCASPVIFTHTHTPSKQKPASSSKRLIIHTQETLSHHNGMPSSNAQLFSQLPKQSSINQTTANITLDAVNA